MKSYLKEFLEKFDYPTDSREAFLKALDKINSNQKSAELFNDNLKLYSRNYNCDFEPIFEACDEISYISDIHEYTVKLLQLICMTKYTLDHYISAGYDENLWYETMLDLKYKLIECKLIKHIDGTFVASWLSGFLKLSRFAFGRLQFEIVECKYNYTKDSKIINTGDPAINIHIPRSETPLTPESCDDACSRAKEFFKDNFKTTPVAFVCSSWLLFPENRNYLGEKSNILKFMNRFDILKVDYYDDGDYSQMWRLFDMDYTGNPDDLPGDTSFRRAYKEHIKSGKPLGTAYGIFFK